MKLSVCALLLAMAAPITGRSQTVAFDPVGKWRVSTVSDEGQPMSVAVEIAGKPGA